ncbi:transcriptional regulator, partial [Candidatus Bathyarchaeota archaeon]|nr:transcriptional regulator [Candidatus Bathyarchaeota archaeon]
MKQKNILVLLIVFSLCFPVALAQEDVIPLSLEVKVYPDGSTLVKYIVESDPTKVRVDVDLFGETYNNLVIRNEDGLPLGFTRRGSGVTVDSIGALELRIVYTTSDLTSKDGPIWNISLTSPTSIVLILPEGAGLFGMSDIP